MALKALSTNGPVISDSLYVNGELIAREFSFSIGEIKPVTAEIQAMGTLNVPINGLIEDTTCTITLKGTDERAKILTRQERLDLEIRAVQSVIDPAGNEYKVGIKYFLTVMPMGVPAEDSKPGEVTDREYTFQLYSYQKVFDGETQIDVSRFENRYVTDGVDWAEDYVRLL